MINSIISALENTKIDNYIIKATKTDELELFFVKKSLQMRRREELNEYQVTVHRDFVVNGEKKRGASITIIHPTMEKEEIERALKDSYYAAKFVSNPYFDLPSPCKEHNVIMDSKLSKLTLEDIASQMIEALYINDNNKNAFINSSEFFIKKITKTIISSNGTNVDYTKYNVNGEFIVQCLNPNDVEIHETFNYDDLNCDALSKKVAENLQFVQDRAKATIAPTTGSYTVLLTEKHVKRILNYYMTKADASFIYRKYSNFEIGTHVQGDNVTGELLNITLKPDAPYSDEGIKLVNRQLIKNGELVQMYGRNRFCRYLNIEPTGEYVSMYIENGTESFENMKKNKCLYVVSFSDFQMDPFTGHFGGEIRLAYLYDNGNKTVLTGGSINGSIFDAHSNFVFSTERYIDRTYDGPYAIKLENVRVAGI